MSLSSVMISRFSLKITWFFIGVYGVVTCLASNGVVEGREKEEGLSAFSPSHPLFPPTTWAIICQSPCFMARLSKTPAVI